LQMFMGEKFGRDSIWETHLAEELWMTQVEVEAVLDQLNMKLSDVFALQPGSQLMLNATPTSLIKMSSGGFPLYTGSMGRKGEQMAIRIEDRLIKDDEEMR
ncbi:MAG: flagellar motor switch protein FliM, partial [Rhodospirillaceae bacterium]|nr:flagellar motor switch protein FliM [Rhodospirillaceae bacterium]